MKLKLLIVILAQSVILHSQEFLQSMRKLSWQEPIYIITNSGDSLAGFMLDYSMEKGGMKELKFKLEKKSKKADFTIDSIQYAYLHGELINSDKENSILNNIKAVEKLVGEDERGLLESGNYGYYEKVEIINKKGKQMVAMMQLLNPDFDFKIKVYADGDFWATTDGGFTIGGFQVEEEKENTYFIKLVNSNEPAFLVRKKDFLKVVDKVFPNCDSLVQKIKEKLVWKDFSKYVFEYNNCNP